MPKHESFQRFFPINTSLMLYIIYIFIYLFITKVYTISHLERFLLHNSEQLFTWKITFESFEVNLVKKFCHLWYSLIISVIRQKAYK